MGVVEQAGEPRVLLAEDDGSMRAVLSVNLEEMGCVVTAVGRGDEAVALLEAGSPPPFDLVVTDVKMPGADGLQVLKAAKGASTEIQVVLVTAFGTVEHAIEAMALGAADYITKPFRRAELKARVQRVLERLSLVRENRELRVRARRPRRLEILTADPRMEEVLRVVDRVAPARVSVLVTGESGTGKELIARRLHEESGRAGEFVPVNCAALPAGMLESELFGHERGAFTGADRRHRGRFEQADGGTLFLDEIGELPLELQAKLLRVLEEGVVDRLGGGQRTVVDARVVAATNRDLGAEVAAGRFREDLFHRLSVIPIHLPPLRERRDDIPLLLRQFLRDSGEPGLAVAPALVRELVRRPWPGNVRELKNAVARMVLLRRSDVLDLVDLVLPGSVTGPSAGPSTSGVSGAGSGAAEGVEPVLDRTLRPGEIVLPAEGFSLPELEREIVLKAMEMQGGNQSAAARYLGIPRHVLLYRLAKYERADGDEPASS